MNNLRQHTGFWAAWIAIISLGLAVTDQVAAQEITFVSDRDGKLEVYVMNADGSGQTNLTNIKPAYDEESRSSPDRTRILLSSTGKVPDFDENSFNPFVMSAEGGGQTNLTSQPCDDHQPRWSPDRTQILFVSGRDGNSEIYVMNADGSGQTNLTKNRLGYDAYPRWSPDGTQILFHTTRDGNLEIYVMNADGSGQTNLSDSLADDAEPRWAPRLPEDSTSAPTMSGGADRRP